MRLIFTSFAFLLLDIISKYLAKLYCSEQAFYITDFFQIFVSRNSNIAFSIPFPHIAQIIFSFILLGILAFYLYKNQPHSQLVFWGSSLIFGGAFGNLYERIVYNEVIDFIDFSFWPSFNLADSFIFLGAISILFWDYKTK